MDESAKKTTLRMIPYGLFVVTTKHEGEVGAATINWMTQVSFQPPLVALGVKADSGTLAHIKACGEFAVNVLGTGQKDSAFAFFKPTQVDGNNDQRPRVRHERDGRPAPARRRRRGSNAARRTSLPAAITRSSSRRS